MSETAIFRRGGVALWSLPAPWHCAQESREGREEGCAGSGRARPIRSRGSALYSMGRGAVSVCVRAIAPMPICPTSGRSPPNDLIVAETSRRRRRAGVLALVPPPPGLVAPGCCQRSDQAGNRPARPDGAPVIRRSDQDFYLNQAIIDGIRQKQRIRKPPWTCQGFPGDQPPPGSFLQRLHGPSRGPPMPDPMPTEGRRQARA